MIGLNWFRKVRSGNRLRAECRVKYGLAPRTWKTRSERTPPYAGCYNIPKGWLEGEVGGHVVTFWGKFGDGFTGEVLVGAFDAWWNRTVSWNNGKLIRHADKGSWEIRLESLRKMEVLIESDPSIERIGVSFKGINFQFIEVPTDLLHRILSLAAETVDGLLARTEPALLKTVKMGDHAQAKVLLEGGADPDEYGPELRSVSSAPYRTSHDLPLLSAIMNDDADLVALLLSAGADLKSNPNYILWIALENGRNKALKALLAGGLKPSPWELPYADDYPLPFAASKGDLEAVRILLEAGVDPNQKRPGFLNDASAKATGPDEDDIRRLVKEAQEREERKSGQLALAPSADGAELSKAEKEK